MCFDALLRILQIAMAEYTGVAVPRLAHTRRNLMSQNGTGSIPVRSANMKRPFSRRSDKSSDREAILRNSGGKWAFSFLGGAGSLCGANIAVIVVHDESVMGKPARTTAFKLPQTALPMW